MSLWGIGQAVIIYLAGLSDISQEYYEAAEVDGATFLQKTFKITLPLLTPVIFFNLVMGFIGAFQQFTLPYAMTNGTGTPADSLTFYVMYLYDNAFSYFRMAMPRNGLDFVSHYSSTNESCFLEFKKNGFTIKVIEEE